MYIFVKTYTGIEYLCIRVYIYICIHPWAENFDTRRISEQTIQIYRGKAQRAPDPFYVASVAE